MLYKRNVLFQINVVANATSTGRIAETIGQMAIARGWHSYIAYGQYANCSQSKLVKIGSKLDLLVHLLQTRLFDRHGLASRYATKKLIKRIEEIEPTIIHLHNIHGYYLNYPLLFDYLSTKNIPIVWTLHDCWPFTGHCAYYSFVECSKWLKGCFDCEQKHTYPQSYFLDNSKDNWKKKFHYFLSVPNLHLVPVSNWLKSQVSISFMRSLSAKVIHNGIDLNLFKPLDISKMKYRFSKRFLILGVANIWEDRKGINDFIHLSTLISSDMMIVLVGTIRKRTYSFPANISLIPNTTNSLQLVELYSVADVFLNLTWQDNYPTTNLEAIACGTPVITYNTGGSVESVVENETGFIVSQGDFNTLLKRIYQIKERGKEAFCTACRNYAEKHFSAKDRFEEYFQLYDSLINK